MEYTMNPAYGTWSSEEDGDVNWLCIHHDCNAKYNSFDEERIGAHVRNAHAVNPLPIPSTGRGLRNLRIGRPRPTPHRKSTRSTSRGRRTGSATIVPPREEGWQIITLPPPGGEPNARRIIPRSTPHESPTERIHNGITARQAASAHAYRRRTAGRRIVPPRRSPDGTTPQAAQHVTPDERLGQLPYIFDSWHGCRFDDEEGNLRWRCFCCGGEYPCIVRDVQRHLRDTHEIETTTVYDEVVHGNNAWQGE